MSNTTEKQKTETILREKIAEIVSSDITGNDKRDFIFDLMESERLKAKEIEGRFAEWTHRQGWQILHTPAETETAHWIKGEDQFATTAELIREFEANP